MMFKLQEAWRGFSAWLDRNICELSEASQKHRASVLFFGVLMLFVNPDTEITFGSASLAGLGITVNPPQTFPFGWLLLFLLIYRFTALWVAVLIDSGTDKETVNYRSTFKHNPDALIPGGPPTDSNDFAEEEAESTIYRWTVRKKLWQLGIPTILFFAILIKYALYVASNKL